MSNRFVIVAAVLTVAASGLIASAVVTADKGVDGANTVISAAEVYNAPPTTPADLGYNDPEVLAVDVAEQMTVRMADHSILEGVTVTRVICVPSGEHLFDCNIGTSMPELDSVVTYLVAPDGLSYVAKAGQ